jgi:nucleoside-diphosphate-sugar epimerase
VATFHAEELVLRCHRPGRLHTYVVCPGVLYGAGEADDQLHGLWRAAWEGQQPLQVCAHGEVGAMAAAAAAAGGVMACELVQEEFACLVLLG